MSSLSLTEPQVEAMPAEEVLRWAYGEFGDRLCLTCSWQKQSSVLVHLVSELGLGIDVIELDTHLFFKETYETREALVARYGLNLIRPEIITVAEQHNQEGPNLWESDPDRCCHIRKVEPLIQALEPYDAWISGIRRDQSPSRADARKVERSERYGVWKIQPLADWDEDRSLELYRRKRHSVQPAARRRVQVDRVHPLHPPDPARRGRARRPLGRLGQARMRHPQRGKDRMRNGFTLWFTGLSGAGKTTIAEIVGPQLEEGGRLVEYLDGDVVRTTPLEGPRVLEGGPRHEHRAHRLGGFASDPPGRRRSRLGDLARTRRRVRRPGSMVEEFGTFVEVFVDTTRRGVRAA